MCVLDVADDLLEKGPGDGHNASVSATFNLAFAHVFTGEETYRDTLMEWVRKGWGQTRLDDFNLMSLAGMALAYDVLYPGLSPADRAAFQDYLDRGLDGYHEFAGSWFLGAGPNFSNTVPVGNSGGMLAGLAMMHSTPDLGAEGGEKTRARETWAPFAFLWRSEQPAPEEFPGVPTLTWLKDMQWGAMRSDGSFKPKLVLGFKGSRGPLTHHKQPDLGSYVLHANGEAYLVDPGYYEPEPSDHTLPLIDGQGPGEAGSDIADGWEEGPWRHVTINEAGWQSIRP